MPKILDLAGQRFGCWTVLRRVVRGDADYHKGYSKWLCRCDCGVERGVQTGALRSGQSQSCGAMSHHPKLREQQAQLLGEVRYVNPIHGDVFTCPYCKGVECDLIECRDSCGWRPEVAAARKDAIRQSSRKKVKE